MRGTLARLLVPGPNRTDRSACAKWPSPACHLRTDPRTDWS